MLIAEPTSVGHDAGTHPDGNKDRQQMKMHDDDIMAVISSSCDGMICLPTLDGELISITDHHDDDRHISSNCDGHYDG